MDTTNVQADPEVAYGGGVFLVVWMDNRRMQNVFNIYAQRVTLQGQVLDPQGIHVSFGDSAEYYPKVAFDGTNYLVAWAGDDRGSGSRLWETRVSPSGVVLDSPAVCLTREPVSLYDHAVAYNGTNYLVAWVDQDSSILGARLTPAGGLLDTIPLTLARSPSWVWTPTLTSDSQNYFLAWADYRSNSYYRIYGTLIRPDGSSLDTLGVPIADPGTEQDCPVLSWDGAHYLCAWEDERNLPVGDTSDIYAVFLDTLGHPGVEEIDKSSFSAHLSFSVQPNPFVSFAAVPGHETERFALYDIAGRKVGTYKGDRVGEGLRAGVYFLKPEGKYSKPLRIVKVR